MATINWHDHRTLEQHILLQHGDFNVFQLLRLLLSNAASTLPIEQRIRFKAELSSAFPGCEFSTISMRDCEGKRINKNSSEGVIEITTANFCIASVLGPLPEPFTEWVRDLVAERVPAMADFLDIFNQRLNVLRFELKQAQTLALNTLSPCETSIAQGLSALMGLATPGLAKQVPLPARAWLGLAGLLANRRKNAVSATDILKLALQANVTLTPFVGGWQTLESQDWTELGVRNQRLGQRSLLGQRVWDQHARIRLEIDGLSYSSACELLPPNKLERMALTENTNIAKHQQNKSYYAHFSSLLRLLLDDLVDCEIIILIAESSIPLAELSSTQNRLSVPSDQTANLRLGQSAWLKTRDAIRAEPRRLKYILRAQDMVRAA